MKRSPQVRLSAAVKRSSPCLSILSLALLLLGSPALGARIYTTHFPSTENPLSEGGNWVDGKTYGLDWSDMRTTGGSPGLVWGTQTGNEIPPLNYADSTALLTGSWGASQTAQVTVHSTNTQTDPDTWEEVEIRLRSSMSAHHCVGYEVCCELAPHDYIQLIAWIGPTYNDWSVIGYFPQGRMIHDGDVIKASIVGNVVTLWVNGVSVGSVTDPDNLFPSGNPGMGFYIANATGLDADYGFTNFMATDDTTAPSAPGTVRDGTGTDIVYTTSTTQLSANWNASTDADSGISGYQYAIGTSVGGTQTVNWTSLGNVTTVTKGGLTLTNGQTYFFSVKAVNGAGLTGSATNSNGQKVDTSAPGAPATVRDGTGTDIVYTTSTTQLSANWNASTDADSGISGYQYAIGTSAGGTQTVNWTSLGNVTTYTKTSLSLTNGQTYFFSVKAVNGAGLTGNATNSNGQKVDSTAPSAPPAVRDGVGADISTTTSTTQLSANWDASTDNESGISGYQYAIGTSAGGTQTVNWTSLGNVTTVTKTGLTLTVGQTYYFGVKAVNGAGLTGSAANSNGQTVVSVGTVTYFSDNFESWTVHGGAWSSVNGESSSHILNTSTDQARAGTKSLKLTDTDTTGGAGVYLTKNFSPTISGDIYVRFYVFLPTGYGSTNVGDQRRMLQIYCGSNRAQMSIKNDTTLMQEIGAWGATYGSTITENAWHCIEMHGATPSSSTLLEFWVDGVKNSTTLNGSFGTSTVWTSINFGNVGLNNPGDFPATFYLDELIVSNAYIGPITSVTYFSDNFENWTVHGGAWSSVNGESSSQILNTSTDQARAGTKSLKLTDTDTTGGSGAYLTENFSPTISGDIYVRFYVFLSTGYGSTNVGDQRRMLQVFCGSNRAQMSIKNDLPLVQEIGAWGQVYGSTISENAWHCFEMHGATPSSSTLLEFWVDGVKNSTTLSGSFGTSTVWTSINFGNVGLDNAGAFTATFYLDELVVSDSYVGTLP